MSAETMVTCTIDGIEIDVPKGTLIIRAAEQAGIMIPRFCDHPLLKPVAACRQCLVDVASPFGPEGKLRPFPKPQPACAIEVTPGMVVGTQMTSAAAKEAQEQVAELVLINHPLDCPVCDKGGECPLQNQAMSTGRPVSRFVDKKNTFPKPLSLTPQILLDRERCVLCQRCTRFALQIPGDPFIALQMRGANQQIGTFDADVLGVAPVAGEAADESTGDVPAVCGEPFAGYFAGNIVQICPVGALTSAAYRFRARPFDLVSTASVAEHDANCSAIRIDYRRGVVLRRQAGDDPTLNQEWISDKDRFGFRWQTAPDRLDKPLVRRDGELVEVSWPVAIAAAAEILGQAKTTAVLPGGRLTLEDAYAYGVFARRVLGTDNVDFRARVSSAEEAQFLAHHVAGSGAGVSLEELIAAPSVVLAGFEPEEEGGILYLRLREAGTKVYALAPFASRGVQRLGGKLIRCLPGQEGQWLSELAALGKAGKPELAGSVIVVGERLASSPGAFSNALKAAAALDAKLVWMPRRAGERAALEAGLLPGLRLGGRAAQDGLPMGLDLAGSVAAAAAGEIDTILFGGLEVSDLPDPHLAREAFAKAKVVALGVRRGAVESFADVILPVAPPQEKAGTFINWEGRVRPFPQVLVSTAVSDAKVLARLAEALGKPQPIGSVAAVHQALAELKPGAERAPAPAVAPPPVRPTGAGEAILSTWRMQVDCAAGLDYEPYLAASAPAPLVRMSSELARELGVKDSDPVAVSTKRGQIVLPCKVEATAAANLIHLPAKSPGSWVLETLGVTSGAVVQLAALKEVGQ
ncbi:MAG: NADH-quinone oxidoreductase subunit G [Bifidobacteriaceae bacterium]|nr:NADH-quinone oxidoreductase subunit G [Bifidobacteriaceae bacterium]